ncbi:hydrogenase maturation nickel metallochaperone HypA [Actinomadura barringtoniae]|uniref:Hydrogenase maturation factor HypA n=1 Tax=Actinomadura barringtoniae TaxID=1427535 RepID=A0A939PLJ4_9ACTN|nr:hydrogenase maturation nickel metallochaperone HypA [Actinomadura barringtoniae]MBO2450781.1 hydrogenase maturation nickel metallochaperone HypA [Actinomadura barringtoniae]
MHEFGLAESILDAVERRAAGRPVSRVRVRAGVLLNVVGPSMSQAYEMVTAGTVAEGSALDLVTVPADLACRGCGHRSGTTDPLAVCPACGGGDVQVTGGDELTLISIEILEARDVPGNPRRDRDDPAGPA